MNSKSTDKIAGKFLGQKVAGKDQYSPEFLVAVPRQENRTYLGLDKERYPEGFDTWYAYEWSALTNSGVPINRVCKIVYPSSSLSIVESKSLKLYLNSFSMTKLGDTFEEVLRKAKKIINRDLINLLNTGVQVSFIAESSSREYLFEGYKDLYDEIRNVDGLEVKEYNENKTLLKVSNQYKPQVPREYVFHSLRSNCRVTGQPDWGDVFIRYTSSKDITPESLVKYLCSFRNEHHFHEEVVECIFTRLSEILEKDDELIVTALYTRRGGIDINPCRYQNLSFQKSDYSDITNLAKQGVFTRYAKNLKQ